MRLFPTPRGSDESSTEDDVPRWTEEDEIRFVLEEENESDQPHHETLKSHNKRSLGRMRIPDRQRLRARHVPGPLYMPALFMEWALHPAKVLLDSVDEYIKEDRL